jgi:glutathione peroxidase
MDQKGVLDFVMKDIRGTDVPLASYRGKALLLVNVASRCGLTPQYKGLQALYDRFRDKGLEILGFPANNFLGQEPGSNEEIGAFCSLNYSVTFPLFSKISVRGKDIHPLYAFLTGRETNPGFDGKIGWNFAKFLADRAGHIVARFDPKTDPLDPTVVSAVEKALAG